MREIQNNSKLSGKYKKDKRCGRNEKNKSQHGSSWPDPYDFLKNRILPISPFGQPDSPESIKVTEEFSQSLNNLHSFYNFPCTEIQPCQYPLNIQKAFHKSKEQLSLADPSQSLELFQDKTGEIYLATVEELDINWTLYFIPLKPLWELHHLKKRTSFQVLMTLYQYLYTRSGMSKFHPGNYTWDTCELIMEQLESEPYDLEEEELKDIQSEWKFLQRVTPILNHALSYKPTHMELTNLMDQWEPADAFESGLKNIAEQMQTLWKEFPDACFTMNLAGELLYPEEEERTYINQYFSFIWSVKGWLLGQLEYFVNSDFQERAFLDVPCSINEFKSKQIKATQQLKYQKRLLGILEQLLDLFNDIE